MSPLYIRIVQDTVDPIIRVVQEILGSVDGIVRVPYMLV